MIHTIHILVILLSVINCSDASIERVIEDYSDVAIAYISPQKKIDKLIVVSGKGFSKKTIAKEALGYAILHPSLARTKKVCLLLKNSNRKGIASERIIWWETETKFVEGYGKIQLDNFLDLAANQKLTHGPVKSASIRGDKP